MTFDLKEKCDRSTKREFFFGKMQNKNIKDVYLGLCFLEPSEKNRKGGPGRAHEEILYLIEGQIRITERNKEIIINEGDAYFMPEGLKITIENLTDKKSYIIIAGGHPVPHSH